MKKKQKDIVGKNSLFLSKRTIIVLALVAAIIVASILFFLVFLRSPEIEFSLKAAIIDQLGEEFQNPVFNDTITNLLIDAGFSVSYYISENVTVNFYKELAKSNYGIIILRAHSALRRGETVVDIFSSEIFSEDAHISEQDAGWLMKGHYLWDPDTYYFAIAPTFIENLGGSFPKSIVIAMGCNSLNSSCTEMADAFYRKGAKVYIGWTGLVDSTHTDSETAKLLELLLSENKTIADAVDITLPDLDNFGSEMDFYPHSAGNLKVSDLINSVKVSQTSQIMSHELEQNLRYLIVSSVSPRARKIQVWL